MSNKFFSFQGLFVFGLIKFCNKLDLHIQVNECAGSPFLPSIDENSLEKPVKFMPNKRYTVTSALPYANGPIHIGHLAGVYIPADIYVRYLRATGKDVLFIGGSDEHGVPITIRAKKENVTPQTIVDKYHKQIKKSFEDLGISFDIYSRTSSQTHHQTASDFFKKLYEDGSFVEKESEQFYDEPNDQFLADRYIIGTCPNCGNPEAYGDQCEKCGSSLSPNDLKDPRSTISGEKPVKKLAKHWYLPLDKYEGWLKKWILEEHQEWKPNVYGQCKSWLDSGLQPRAVTRDLDWGVKVPIQGADGKVLYVWFDAPIGYISATIDWANEHGKDWEPYWKDKGTQLVHFIGKDNIVFHCIVFPTMLKAHGEFILPDNIPANEFLNLEGNKLSTSRNWAVWLHEYLEEFPDKQDVLRYVLCATAPESKDNDFTWKDFQARNNNELVAILGNFINRAVVLTHKYFGGIVPPSMNTAEIDIQVLSQIDEFKKKIGSSIENYKFREALSYLMDLARLGNKYLADTEPWKLIKTDKERVESILYVSLQLGSALAATCGPFMPSTASKIAHIFNIEKLDWENTSLESDHAINKPELLFEKIEDDVIQKQIDKLRPSQPDLGEDTEISIPDQKEVISFDDFMKMDIRIGTITEAEKVKKSNKLLKFKVDTGIDQRTVLSGIAKYYKPEDMIGKQVTLLVNLTPRKIMGEESQGMILMAEDNDGSLRLLQPGEPVGNGSIVG